MTAATVVTMGVFDGFHLGHAAVVDRARERAAQMHARLVVFTFERRPQAVLGGGQGSRRLTTLSEKSALLREAGADEVRVLRFTPGLASKSARRFLADHVYPYHRLAAMVVGYDFAMGHRRRGTVPALRTLGEGSGFLVEAVGARMDGGEAISSTRVRSALAEGEVPAAARWLGRPYRLCGAVQAGEGRGRTLGFPTANLRVPEDKERPARGVYAVWISGPGLARCPGVVNLGRRPTFGGGEETVEAHLLGFRGELLGRRLCLEFVERIRPEVKFNDANELKRQINGDVKRARQALAEALPETG